MEVPGYIAALLQPQPSKPTGRKVWSIDLETVWLPFPHGDQCDQDDVEIDHSGHA